MTREEAKQNTWKAHCNFDDPRKAIYIVIDQIFNDNEAQLKAKEEEISKYQMAIYKQSKRAEALKQLSLDKDKEIERLKGFEELVELMEVNSNRSLCDYYNNKDNS